MLFRSGTVEIVPEQLGAGPGDVIEYRGMAADARAAGPNVTYSKWQSLVVDASAPPRPAADQPRQGQSGDRPEDKPSGTDQDAGDAGKPGPGDDGKEKGKDNENGQDNRKENGKAGSGKDEQDPADTKQATQPETAEGKPGTGKQTGDGPRSDEKPDSQRKPEPAGGGKEQGQPQEGKDRGQGEGGKPQDSQQGRAGKQQIGRAHV